MTLPSADDDGLPGFNALAKYGCVPDINPPSETSELWGWTAISDAVKASNVTVEGTITAISEPRISTLEIDGALSQFYFRVIDIKVDRSDIHDDSVELAPTVQVQFPGAGSHVAAEELCYGPDGFVEGGERERPMKTGSEVTVLGRFGQTPVGGFESEVLALPRGLNTFWVSEDGVATSAVAEYSADREVLWGRLQQEVQAKREGRPLEIQDAFSVAPIRPELTRPTTPVMVPPGIDAGTTPTSQP